MALRDASLATFWPHLATALPTKVGKKAHPASIFREGQTITFLDMPAETRMQIYSCILDEEEPITITMIRRRGATTEIARGDNHRDKHHRGQIYDKSSKTWKPAPPSKTAIMFVNQQIYAESSQALYGNNVFVVETTTVLGDFLERLGKRCQHLRRIHIGSRFGTVRSYVLSSIRPALKLLCQASGLKELHFQYYDFCTHRGVGKVVTATQLVDDCGTLLRSLHASHQTQNLTTNVLNVLQISNTTELWYACPAWGMGMGDMGAASTQLAKETVELNVRVRSLVAKKLRISET